MDGRCKWAVEVAERWAEGEGDYLKVEKARVEAGHGVRAMDQPPLWAAYYTLPSTIDGNLTNFDKGNAITVMAHASSAAGDVDGPESIEEKGQQAQLLRDIFGNPFRPIAIDPRWLTSNVVELSRAIYDERAFEKMPILADALMDAGCDSDEIIAHCRGDGPHVRGCWVVDLLTGRE